MFFWLAVHPSYCESVNSFWRNFVIMPSVSGLKWAVLKESKTAKNRFPLVLCDCICAVIWSIAMQYCGTWDHLLYLHKYEKKLNGRIKSSSVSVLSYLKWFAYKVHNLFSFTLSSSLKRTKLCGNWLVPTKRWRTSQFAGRMAVSLQIMKAGL